jgi:inorganic pyrophosphatase
MSRSSSRSLRDPATNTRWITPPAGSGWTGCCSPSTRYPLDYGFIPDTLGEDGDPLDAMVILAEPTFPGCLVLARPVGVFWMHDEHGPDAKILTVPARDPRYAGMQDFADVPEHLTTEIGHFFDVYKELEPGKGTDVRGWQGCAAAEQVIEAAFTQACNPARPGRGAFRSGQDAAPGRPPVLTTFRQPSVTCGSCSRGRQGSQ